jgi:hypothetical protein
MKTMKQISIVLAAVALVAGCAKSKSGDATDANAAGNANTVAPVVIDPNAPLGTGGTAGTIYSSGSVSDFSPVSLSVMNTYVATHPLNNPTNFKININLNSPGNSRYGGEVSISYMDNGIQYNGVFKAGLGKNQSYSGMYDNDRLEADYNYWFKLNNQVVFTGFFEDQYGAITLTIVPVASTTTNNNDGEPVTATAYKGYVYFKNFLAADGRPTGAPHGPARACWYIYKGPYDCRSNVIQFKGGLAPGAEAGYQLLGTFSTVDIPKAFNIQ